MVLVTYGCNYKTNIDKSTQAYEWLQEINERLGEEKLIITVTDVIDGTIFNRNRKVGEYYSIYWDLGKGEYQQIMSIRGVNYQGVEAYLLGILTGMDKAKFL